MTAEEKEVKFARKFWSKVFDSIVLLPIIMWIWPNVVPFGFFEFWSPKGTVTEWLTASWPIFAWAACTTTIIAFATKNNWYTNAFAEDILKDGFVTSAKAGIGEEITFRWLFFLDAVVAVKISNFLFFGFLGFGIPAWFQLHFTGPIADFVTHHSMHNLLFHPMGWAVGAAMLSTNAFFRDGHRYQGPLGLINSWVIGMFLFWLMFRYGLPAAILVHFTYDFIIYFIRFLDAAMERKMGYA
jgi:hypothetical protein